MGSLDHANGPRFRCPYCTTTAPPERRTKVSTGGWVLFVLLALACVTLPFCWIGLLIRDEYRVCHSCGINLG